MQFADATFIILSLASMTYLLMFASILRSRRMTERPVWLLEGYLLSLTGWSAALMILRMSQMELLQGFDLFALERVGVYGLFIHTVLFYQLTWTFQKKDEPERIGWAAGAAVLGLALVLYENPLHLPDTLFWVGGYQVVRWLLAFVLIVAGWGVFLGRAVLITLRTYRLSGSPLHRNRNKYWSLAVMLTTVGQSLLLAQHNFLGALLQLMAAFATTYVALTYALPDLRQASRQFTSYLFMTVITASIYMAGFYVAQLTFQSVPGYSPLTVGAGLALVLAMLFNPLLNLVQRLVNRLISGSRYDLSQTLSEYSMSISNILDLEVLATVVVGLISEAMEIRHGALVTVTHETGPNAEEGQGLYSFHPVSGLGQVLPEGSLSERNPVAYFLGHERQPLTQYDIDLLPRFSRMDADDRAWLNNLSMDVYVPIYVKDQWIGLLVLGQKVSGDSYFDQDLAMLKTLADQTAVALENARLYENLKQRNAENERLNGELTDANAKLARLDQAKSDFINIASHELRTPLTHVIGYTDILAEMIQGEALEEKAGLEITNNVRKAARRLEEIVNTMFEVSKLDTQTLDLMEAPVSLAAVISLAGEQWNTAMEEREISLSVRGLAYLPTLLADGKRLTKVFAQLIQNAIKSTPDGGQVRITGRLIEADEGERRDGTRFVEVMVADTGVGIAPEELERIFEKFYRVGDTLLHSTGSTKFKGAGPGLGLTIARGIVEAHGGRIWAESDGYNEDTCPGARFYVWLPVKMVEVVETVSAPSSSNGKPQPQPETQSASSW